MRLPCENYVRFLLVGTESRWSMRDVRKHLARNNYPDPGVDYLISLRQDLERTRPHPYLVGGRPPRTWLMRQGLWDLARPNAVADDAAEILGDQDIRPALEALLLAGLAIDRVQEAINDLYGFKPTPELLSHYQHFYWNVRGMGYSDWLTYLEHHKDGDQLAICYAADPDYVLYHLGLKTNKSIQDMVMGTARLAYYRLQETKLAPLTRGTSIIIKSLGDLVMKANQEVATVDTLTQLIDHLRSIGMKLIKTNMRDRAALPPGEIIDGTILPEAPPKDLILEAEIVK